MEHKPLSMVNEPEDTIGPQMGKAGLGKKWGWILVEFEYADVLLEVASNYI